MESGQVRCPAVERLYRDHSQKLAMARVRGQLRLQREREVVISSDDYFEMLPVSAAEIVGPRNHNTDQPEQLLLSWSEPLSVVFLHAQMAAVVVLKGFEKICALSLELLEADFGDLLLVLAFEFVLDDKVVPAEALLKAAMGDCGEKQGRVPAGKE